MSTKPSLVYVPKAKQPAASTDNTTQSSSSPTPTSPPVATSPPSSSTTSTASTSTTTNGTKEKKPFVKREKPPKEKATAKPASSASTTATPTTSTTSTSTTSPTSSFSTSPTPTKEKDVKDKERKERPKKPKESKPKKVAAAVATLTSPPESTTTTATSSASTTTTTSNSTPATPSSKPAASKPPKKDRNPKPPKKDQDKDAKKDDKQPTTPKSKEQSTKTKREKTESSTPSKPKAIYTKKDNQASKEEEKKKKEEQERLEKERKEAEERKRIEEEERKRIEEEKRLEEERIEKEKQEKLNQERLLKQKEELQQIAQIRTENQMVNKNPSSRNALMAKLDSSFKRISNFLKKMKVITDIENKESLLTEIAQLNLQQYTTEIVPSIIKSPFKTTDIPVIVRIFSLLHQRYEGVDACVQESLFQLFQPLSLSITESESDRSQKIIKRRNAIRLILDLYYADILHSYSPILKLVGKLTTSQTFEQDKELGYPSLIVFSSFVRPITFYIGLNKKNQMSLGLPDIYSNILTTEEQTATKDIINNYYTKICECIQKEQQILREKEKEMRNIMVTKGELTETFQQSYDLMRKNYEKLITNASTYADLIGAPLPSSDYSTKVENAQQDQKQSDQLESFDSPFETEEQKKFYEKITALPKEEKKSNTSTSSPPSTPTITSANSSSSTGTSSATSTPPTVEEKEKKDENIEKKPELTEAEKKALKTKNNQMFEELIQKLKSSTLKISTIDQAIQMYLKLNLKPSKKKILIGILTQSRQDQIPFFARFVAILNQSSQHKDFVQGLCQHIEEDLTNLIEKKEQIHLAVKIRSITFIGELIKFKVLPNTTAFNYLKLCFDDFTHHNIDIACTLLEVCGRYLYRLAESQFRLRNMLDILIRHKNAKVMEVRQESMIDNAYLTCRPAVVVTKQVDPVKQFSKFLLFRYLSDDTVKSAYEKLLHFPWPSCQEYLAKYFLAVQKQKFGNIYLIADLLFRLKRACPSFVRTVIWRLLEDITVGFEKNDFSQNQKRIMQATLFGELYNSCLLDTYHIFSLLVGALEYGYSAIHLFPVNSDVEREILMNRYTPKVEEFDPPNDSFRVRFICSLILVCKDCFYEEEIANQLKPYLVFLQRYAFTKQLSMELDFMLTDCLSIVPRMKVYKSWEEANEECLKYGSIYNILLGTSGSGGKNKSAKKQQNAASQNKDNNGDEDGEDDSSRKGHRRKEQHHQHQEVVKTEEDIQREKEEEAAYLFYKQQQEETEEDLEFMREFKKTMQDSADSRKNEKIKINLPSIHHNITSSSSSTDVSPPLSSLGMSGIQSPFGPSSSSPTPEGMVDDQQGKKVAFQFLMKKGNRSTAKTIDIPEDTDFVSQIKLAKENEERILQENKKLILKMTQNT